MGKNFGMAYVIITERPAYHSNCAELQRLVKLMAVLKHLFEGKEGGVGSYRYMIGSGKFCPHAVAKHKKAKDWPLST